MKAKTRGPGGFVCHYNERLSVVNGDVDNVLGELLRQAVGDRCA
ncbi:MAG: hypothetical protein AAF290_10330 [Pseudomonadota bacterium]